MRTLNRILLASGGAALAVLSVTPAHAQKDIQPPLPNVLLLIDNSGSMEYLMDPTGKLPGDAAAPGTACNGATGLVAKNRWANLVTVLTGSIAQGDFSCQALDRHSATFINEFTEQGAAPYDQNYYLPFNRIYSNGCTYGAGTLDPNWSWWNLPNADGIHQNYQMRGPSGALAPACSFKQSGDGLLDAFRGLVRFGMMTLDTFPDAGTGSTATSNVSTALADYPSGQKGMWSYFHNWVQGSSTPTAPAQPPPTPIGQPGAGKPAGCATPSFFEVGARNQAAPPWEGRLVPFGNWQSDANVPATNDQIQMELLSSRPYGATPVAAMLDDANEFLFGDVTNVPTSPTNPTSYRFGPSDDQYWINGCRKTYIILMSDGQPNMDLRAHGAYNGCDSMAIPPKGGGAPIAGACPYLPADQIATNLRMHPPPSQSVITYVVGFTSSDITNKIHPTHPPPSNAATCDKLTLNDCINPDPLLVPCCELQKIAIAGGTSRAYFADDPIALKSQLASILSQVIQGTTDRTSPVYAIAGNPQAQGAAFGPGANNGSYEFTASFHVTAASAATGGAAVGNLPGGMWTGSLVRERYECPTATAQAIDGTKGDDYALNVDYADGATPRRFFTAIGTVVPPGSPANKSTVATILSDNTMRPYIGTTDDGFGTYQPDSLAPTAPQITTSFPGAMAAYPSAFGIPSDQACSNAFGNTNPAICTTDIVRWEIGLDNTVLYPATFQTRNWQSCPSTCSSPQGCACRQLGAIFHSTPTVTTPPREFLRDDSYTTYSNTPAVSSQEEMLYTATMDGQLHAFKVQSGLSTDPFNTDHRANNERWSFFPPRVLQHILPNFNVGGVPLLDGVPVVADVPGAVYDLTLSPNLPPVLERDGTSVVQWHRILVSSGGGGGGFYYALEITDPENPHFLWQISSDAIGAPLFGSSTPTPAIAIVNISLTANSAPVQVPVAILAGGATGSKAGTCSSQLQTSPATASNGVLVEASVSDASNPHLLPSVVKAPPPLRCWDMTKNTNRSSGNSLTIVRLDNGKVLGHFVGNGYQGAPHNGSGPDGGGTDGNGGDSQTEKEANNHNVFAAPFRAPLTGVPVAFPGQTGQVSDRVYIGDADGLLWRVDMSNPDITTWGASIGMAWDAYMTDMTAQREGIGVAPIVSRDAIGNPVILVATGDQDTFSVQQSTNNVWSLTENPLTHAVSPNWHITMPSQGARVTGPMALFNGVLYFASFLPQVGTNVCSDGYGSVWGVDYVRHGPPPATPGGTPAGMAALPNEWPMPQFPSPAAQGAFVYGQDGAPGTIVMGVSLSQTPNCDNSSSSPDPVFGSHSAVTPTNSASYQVSWQTGAGAGLSAGAYGAKTDSNVTGLQYIQPPPPGKGTRIDSWASIVE